MIINNAPIKSRGNSPGVSPNQSFGKVPEPVYGYKPIKD